MKQHELPMIMPFPLRKRKRGLAKLGAWVRSLDSRTIFVMLVPLSVLAILPILQMTRGRSDRLADAEQQCQNWGFDGVHSPKSEPFACEITYRTANGKPTTFVFDMRDGDAASVAVQVRSLRDARDAGAKMPNIEMPNLQGYPEKWQKAL